MSKCLITELLYFSMQARPLVGVNQHKLSVDVAH